jgi:CubicO group peptidase (beta-lactamase class C family)
MQMSAFAGLSCMAVSYRDWNRSPFAPAPPSRAKKQFQPFADRVQQAMTDAQIPGIAVGLIRANKLVYADGFGVRNLNTGAPMTSTSVMSMASISKAFTGAGIMQLIEAGKIGSIDDTFLSYVPYFTMADPRYTQITLRHQLSHTSGLLPLDYVDFFGEFMTPDYDAGAAERLVRSLSTDSLYQEPDGPAFQYSDVGYDILADLIHKVSGELFEDYMRSHIFDPLKMKHSTFLVGEIDPDDLVVAHVRDEDGNVVVWDYLIPYDRKHAPSSCLHCSVEDYSLWLLAMMNGGAWHGKRILTAENQAKLWEMLYLWNPDDVLQGYGWGWELGNFMGHQLVTSFGGQPGVQTVGMLLPTEGMGVIVLGNCLGTFNPDVPDPYVVGDLAFWALEWMLSNDAVLQSSDDQVDADVNTVTPAASPRSLYLPFVQHTAN